nr:hypothetical protein [Bryobacterales bacterium]
MKRTSILGPVILITLGALLLWVNLSGGAEVLQLLSVHWPWILVAWGGIRLAELLYWSQQGVALPARGLSGGEWFLAVLICLAGSGLHSSRMVLGDLGNFSLGGPGLRMFGESYDFTVADQAVATGTSARLLVENLRGEVMVTADDVEDVRVSGRESLRAISEDDAKDAWESRRVTVDKQGDLVVVRTNQEGMSSDRRARAYLQIRVPRNCSLETRGRNVSFEVTGLQGAVDLQADEGQASVTDIKGNVTVRLPRSSDVRVRGVQGTVDLSSARGDNLSLREVRGPVTVKGSFSGNIELRQIAGTLRVEDRGGKFTRRNRRSAESSCYFIVRSNQPGRDSKILLQLSTHTYNAYNNWGGFSLYAYNGRGGNQGHRVSYLRPPESLFPN